MLHHIKKITPGFLVRVIKKNLKNKRERRLNVLKNSGDVLTKTIIVQILKANGLKKGDSLLVHSSLSRLGYIDDGPQTMLDSLFEVIDAPNTGTLILPTFPNRISSFEYLEDNSEFDVLNTPSAMGKITELLRTKYNCRRSIHPTHPVVAYGPKSEYFTQEHYGQLTPFNTFSPFYKLGVDNGKILMLGVKLESMTNFHVLEDEVGNFPFKVYADKVFDVTVIDENGTKSQVKTKAHNPILSAKRRCNELEYLFEKGGALTKFKFGIADCYLLNAKKMNENMIEGYNSLGITMYTPNGIK